MTVLMGIVVGFAGVLGLLIGSFLNVVAYRVPEGRSVVSPASACPSCGSAIRPWDNIPVFSWLILRGRCRDCSTPISVRYPLVEAATGLAFAAVCWWAITVAGGIAEAPPLPTVFGAFAFLLFAGVSIVLALIDADTHRLPDVIVLPTLGVGAVLLLAAAVTGGGWGDALRAVVGSGVLFTCYLLLALAYRGGMGFGDVKLAAVIGMYLGWSGWSELIVGSFAAFVLGGLYAVVLLGLRRTSRGKGIPFGPWMLAGCWVGVFWGEPLARFYLSIVGLN
ncbi:peptidase A24 [Leifsonia sp. Leaf336]|uniref:prepilin peptidase n=1 Tax=Leifsonia sp. Leaf336 TaxID=1736341 RepID=UPI0006F4DD18|nr:A24 family peptidase [Leifsonia sp. Leaf336]KQR53790.1 peptidase A24 [Leifsonia sp. Leaf336]